MRIHYKGLTLTWFDCVFQIDLTDPMGSPLLDDSGQPLTDFSQFSLHYTVNYNTDTARPVQVTSSRTTLTIPKMTSSSTIQVCESVL